jgi:hypothetical protein
LNLVELVKLHFRFVSWLLAHSPLKINCRIQRLRRVLEIFALAKKKCSKANFKRVSWWEQSGHRE